MRNMGYFLLVLALAAAAGSILQSLVNLAAINSLTAAVSWSDRISTLAFDLRHFMPVLAAIFLPLLLVGLIVSALLQRWLSVSAYLLHFVITACVTLLALLLINQLAPMPTLIALNRTLGGTLALISCPALAAVLFHFLRFRRNVA